MSGTPYSAGTGFGWLPGSVMEGRDRNAPTPLLRDLNLGAQGTFAADYPNGQYNVALTMGDPWSDRDQVAVFLEGTRVDTVSTLAGNWVTKTFTVSVTDGQLTLRLQDLGGVNGEGAIQVMEVTPAVPVNAAPVIGAFAATPNPVTRPGNVMLSATGVSDQDGTVASVAFYRETNGTPGLQTGAGSDLLLGTAPASPYEITFATGGLVAGNYTYYAVATDNAGATSVVRSAVHTLDDPPVTSAPPVIDSLTAAPSPVTSGASVTLTANGVSDPDTPVSKVEFYRESNGQAGLQTGQGGDVLLAEDTTSPYAVAFSTAGLAPGNYAVYARAIDTTDQVSPVVTSSVTVTVNQLPAISSFSASPDPVTGGGSVTLTAVAGDPDGTVTGVTFYRESNGIPGLQSGAGGDEIVGHSSGSAPSNRRPNAPVIIEPLTDGERVYSQDVHMETQSFSDPDAGQLHSATDWEIWTSGASPVRVWSALGVTAPATRVHIHFGDGTFEGPQAGKSRLEADTDYVLRVRHYDNSGDPTTNASLWSTRTFHTFADQLPSAVDWTVDQSGYRVEEVPLEFDTAQAGNQTALRLPTHITFVPNPGPHPDDVLFYFVELYGTIRSVTRDLTVRTYATGVLNFNPEGPIAGSGETGLGDVAVDPATGDLFATMLYDPDGAGPIANLYPKVVRYRSADGGKTAIDENPAEVGTQGTDILRVEDTADSTEEMGASHIISAINFGPDGKLYVQVGDGFLAERALNLDSFGGKVLRMNTDGSAPADNPFFEAGDQLEDGKPDARDYVYAYGFRNPYGGVFNSADGMLYVVDNGPSANDRFAKIREGVSYGWDSSHTSMLTNALYNWADIVAPVGVAFVEPQTFGGSAFPSDKFGSAFVTGTGPTAALGPNDAKAIFELPDSTDFDGDGDPTNDNGALTAPVTTLVRYTGAGRSTLAGLAAGPDGLYFSSLYNDDPNNEDVIAPGAKIFRVVYVGESQPLSGGAPAPLGGIGAASVDQFFSITVPSASFGPGTHKFYAVATDDAGATSAAASVQVTVAPNSVPSLTGLSVTPNSAVSSATVSLAASGAADTDGTIASVAFYRESNGTAGLQTGAGGDVLLSSDTTGPAYQFDFATTGLRAGSYQFYAVATDNGGGVSSPVSATLTVTNDLPTLTSLSATPSTVPAGASVSLSANGPSDTNGSVASVTFYRESNGVAGLQSGAGGDTVVSIDTAAPFAATASTIGLAVGNYTYYTVPTDDLGDSGAAVSTIVTIAQNQAPTLTSLTVAPASGFTGSGGTLTANGAADADGSVASVAFYRESNGTAGLQTGAGGDTLIATDASSPFSSSFSTVGLAAGTYTYYAIATDDLGASSVPVSGTQTLSAPPVVTTYKFDFGIPGSPVAAGYTAVNGASGAGSTPYSAATGYGWMAGSDFSGRDRQYGGDELTRDINIGRNGTFAVDLADGVYEVKITFGDLWYGHDQMGIFIEGTQVDSVTTVNPGDSVTKTYSASVSDHQLNVRITDLGGTSAEAAIQAMVVTSSGPVNQAPTINSFTATPSPVIHPGDVTLTATGVTDSDGAVIGVAFYRETNGTAGLQTGTGGDSLISSFGGTGSFQAVVNGSALSPGTQTFYAQATDDQGATRVVSTTATVQNPAPTVASITASPNPVTAPAPLTLTAGGVSDSNGTVASVAFYRESNGTAGLQTGTGGDTLISTDSTGPDYTATFNTTGLPGATYTLYAVATDNLGATSTPASTTATVQAPPNQNPTIASLSVAPTSVQSGTAATLTANNVLDQDGTIASVAFYRESNGTTGLQLGAGGDTLVGTDASSPYSLSASTTGLAAGTYSFYAQATDNAGGLSNIVNTILTVTAPPPPPVSYKYDFGLIDSPVEPGYTQVAGISGTPYTAARGFGWLAGSVMEGRDRGGPTNLLRDLNIGTQGTFVIDVPNGQYSVTVTMGDPWNTRDQMAVSLEGARVDTITTSQAGVFAVKTYTVNVGDGQLTLNIQDLGGVTSEATIQVLEVSPVGPVNQSPTIGSFTASPNPVTTPANVTLTAANVSDSDGTIGSVAFYRESNGTAGLQTGTGGDTLLNTLAAGPYTHTLASSALGAGTFTFYALATDDKNATATATTTLTVTNTAPTIGSLSASPDPVTAPNPLGLTANSVADANGSVASVSFYRESNGTAGLQTGTGGDTLISTDSAGPAYTASLNTSGLPGATYTFYAVATDDLGATSGVASTTATIQAPPNQNPTIGSLTIAPTSVSSGTAATLTANNVADGDGSIASVAFYRESNGTAGLQTGAGGDTLVGSDATSPYSLSAATTGLSAATYTFYALATDNVGGLSNVVSNTLTVTPSTTGPLRKFDFGDPASPVEPGYTGVFITSAYSQAAGYGWLPGAVGLDSRDRNGPTALLRDFNWAKDATFVVDSGVGNHTVKITVGDEWKLHDQMGIYIEGQLVDTLNTAAGNYAVKTYNVYVADGQVTIQIKDLGGTDAEVPLNALEVQLVSGTINQAPTITGLTASPNPVTYGNTLTLSAQGVGDDGGAPRVDFYRESNGAAGLQIGPGGDTLLGTDGSGPAFDFSLSTTGLPAATYTFYGRAVDDLGLSAVASTTATVVSNPNNQAPTVGSLTATENAGIVTLAAANVADADGTVTFVNFYRESNGIAGLQPGGDALVGSDATSPYAITFDPSTLAAGNYTFYAVAVDEQGAQGAPASTTYTATTPRRFDFGTASSPVAAGYTQVTESTAYSAAQGYGWSYGTIYSEDRFTSDPLTRDENITTYGTFSVDVANGVYDVTITAGDTQSVSDGIVISLEGEGRAMPNSPVGAYVTSTFRVQVDDGQLTINFQDNGGTSPNGIGLNSMIVRRVGSAPTLTSVTASPNPQSAGGQVTLTANGVSDADGTTPSVSFYREGNGVPGLQVAGRVLRVMPLGDSITDGWTAAAGGYRKPLLDRFAANSWPVDFVGDSVNNPAAGQSDPDHSGHPGWRIDEINAFVTPWLKNHRPDVILLHLGTNDILQNTAAATINQRLTALLQTIFSVLPDTHVVVAQIIPIVGAQYQATLSAYNSAIPGIVQSFVNQGFKASVADLFSAVPTSDLPDGVHPNPTGASKMATAWYNAILNNHAASPTADTLVATDTNGAPFTGVFSTQGLPPATYRFYSIADDAAGGTSLVAQVEELLQ